MRGIHFFLCIIVIFLFTACGTQLATTDWENDYTRYIDEEYRDEYHEPVYYVIVSSFASKKNAKNIREKIANEGYDSLIIKSKKRFRVAIGRYSNKKAAGKAKDNYNASHTPGNAWILVGNKEYN